MIAWVMLLTAAVLVTAVAVSATVAVMEAASWLLRYRRVRRRFPWIGPVEARRLASDDEADW